MKKIALTVAVLIASVGVLVGTASAFNPADLQKLKTTGNCADCDLSGANLAGANLNDAYLAGANLSNAILEGASLAHANLSRAKLSGTNLYVVDLTNATWTDRSECEKGFVGSCTR